jgi:hypothetical protein
MARKTRLTPYGEQIVEAFDLDESGSEFTSYRSTPSMAAKDGLPSDDPAPLFLSDRAEEPEQPGIGKAWDRAAISSRILKTSILVVTAAAIVFAILGNPIALFAKATASLVGQPGTGQQFQAWAAEQDARARTTIIQSTTGAQALPPTARDAPTRAEIVAAFNAAHQSQTETRQPPAEALLKQFQAWATEQDAQAQVQKQR